MGASELSGYVVTSWKPNSTCSKADKLTKEQTAEFKGDYLIKMVMEL